MFVYHAAITAAENYFERGEPYRAANLERLMGLRTQGLLIGGGPPPDGRSADAFFRVPQPADVSRLIEETPLR